MTIWDIAICIIIVWQCSTCISIEENTVRKFPVIPRSGHIVAGPPSIAPDSHNQLHAKENVIKAKKTGTKLGQLSKVDGSTQQSNPMFVKIINKNLSKASAVNRKKSQIRPNSGNNSLLLLKRTGWQYSSTLNDQQQNRTSNEKLEDTGNADLNNSKATSCVPIGEEHKPIELEESLRFWDLAFNSTNGTESLDMFHISTVSRKCSTHEVSTLCCEETAKNVEIFITNNTDPCSSPQESTKCREFCISRDPETVHVINSTDLPCQEGAKLADKFSMLSKKSQTIVFNKTSAIIFREQENARNPELQSWAQQMLQNLNGALNKDTWDGSSTLFQESANNSIILSQWIEFPESKERIINQKAAWQLLKDYQRYDENLSNNLIRICTTNQDDPKFVCTEQYHQNMCLLDDPDGCMDDMLTVQMSSVCRQFMVQDEQIIHTDQISCEPLNESLTFRSYLHEASGNTAEILILQLLHTKVIHSFPAANPGHDRSKNKSKKWQKHANGVKLKTEGRTGVSQVKIIEMPFFEESTTTGTFEKADRTAITVDPGNSAPVRNEIASNDISVEETTVEAETAKLKGLTELPVLSTTPENWKEIDETLKNAKNTTVSNTKNMDEFNVTVELQVRTIDGFERKAMTKDDNNDQMRRKERPLWEPFHMDCSLEKDEFNITSCSDWAAAGYCLSNNATRFLWCRRTCLCVGPPQL